MASILIRELSYIYYLPGIQQHSVIISYPVALLKKKRIIMCELNSTWEDKFKHTFWDADGAISELHALPDGETQLEYIYPKFNIVQKNGGQIVKEVAA